jgi:hypothetical protein
MGYLVLSGVISTEHYSKANRDIEELAIEIIPASIKEGSKVIGYFSHIAGNVFCDEMQLV